MLESAKLQYVVVHLKGDVPTRGATIDDLAWSDYVRAITTRFADSMLKDTMGELTTLYQTRTLKYYCRSFDAFLSKATICEEYAVSIFLCSLIPTIWCLIKIFKPRSLRDAYSLAHAQELTNATMSSALGSRSPKQTFHGTSLSASHGAGPSTSSFPKVPINATKLPILPTLNRPTNTLSSTNRFSCFKNIIKQGDRCKESLRRSLLV